MVRIRFPPAESPQTLGPRTCLPGPERRANRRFLAHVIGSKGGAVVSIKGRSQGV
jgi:hypothetical protein